MSLTSLTSVASQVTQCSLQPPSSAPLQGPCAAGSGTAPRLLQAGGGSGKMSPPPRPRSCVLEPRPLVRPLITLVPREREPAARTPWGSEGRAHTWNQGHTRRHVALAGRTLPWPRLPASRGCEEALRPGPAPQWCCPRSRPAWPSSPAVCPRPTASQLLAPSLVPLCFQGVPGGPGTESGRGCRVRPPPSPPPLSRTLLSPAGAQVHNRTAPLSWPAVDVWHQILY